MREMNYNERLQRVIDKTMSLTIELVKMDNGQGDISVALDIARQIQNDEIELINMLNEREVVEQKESKDDLKIFEFMELEGKK